MKLGVARPYLPRTRQPNALLTALVGLALGCLDARAAPAEPCPAIIVAVDSTKGSVSGDIILGKAWGESFVAPDTILSSARVWRIPSEAANPSDLKFWITEVDSTGKPHTHLVVYEGPTISVVSADTSRPTPIVYTFDPPVHLPRPGQYC